MSFLSSVFLIFWEDFLLAQNLVSTSFILTCNLLKEASSPSSGGILLPAVSDPASGNNREGGSAAKSLGLSSAESS